MKVKQRKEKGKTDKRKGEKERQKKIDIKMHRQVDI